MVQTVGVSATSVDLPCILCIPSRYIVIFWYIYGRKDVVHAAMAVKCEFRQKILKK